MICYSYIESVCVCHVANTTLDYSCVCMMSWDHPLVMEEPSKLDLIRHCFFDKAQLMCLSSKQ